MTLTRKENSNKIKEQILITSAELFANNDYSEMGLRGVAKEANVTLNTITYHFGSKEALYNATLDYTFNGDCRFNSFKDELAKKSISTKQELSDIIYATTFELLYSTIGDTSQRWRAKLFTRVLIDNNKNGIQLGTYSTDAINEQLKVFFDVVDMGLTDEDFNLWLTGFWGEVLYVSFNNEVTLDRFGYDEYCLELIEKLAAAITSKNLKILDLPAFNSDIKAN